MRVAVVSTPRTCSSFLGNIMSLKYNLKDYSEIFSYNSISNEEGLKKLNVLKETDDYSVKITATSFLSHSEIFTPQTFPWEIFDKIIFAERQNIEYQVASWAVLSYAQMNGHYGSDEIKVFLEGKLETPEVISLPIEGTLNNMIDTISYYYDVLKPAILDTGLPASVVYHELLQSKPIDYIEELNIILNTDLTVELVDRNSKTELDYTAFVNYYNLKQLIEDRKLNATKEENTN